MSENLIHKVGKNIQEKSNLIWEVATTLAGPFKPHEYGTVILPMAIIKRFHDCLLPTHDKVVKKSAELDAKKIAVYDMAMGTSQMLTCMTERLNVLDPKLEVKLYGQEINPFTYGIAKADMMIRGGNPDDMRYGDTLSDDKFGGYEFDYIISNPPFGIDWKKEAKSVEDEAYKKSLIFETVTGKREVA